MKKKYVIFIVIFVLLVFFISLFLAVLFFRGDLNYIIRGNKFISAEKSSVIKSIENNINNYEILTTFYVDDKEYPIFVILNEEEIKEFINIANNMRIKAIRANDIKYGSEYEFNITNINTGKTTKFALNKSQLYISNYEVYETEEDYRTMFSDFLERIANNEFISVNDTISRYNNPTIPDGFKAVETNNASWDLDNQGVPKGWNDGLVIEDSNGNQFVWVPCTKDGENGSIRYGRYVLDSENDEFVYLQNNVFKYPTSDWRYCEINAINREVLASIEKYQGFYIGRYEAGIENAVADETPYIYQSEDYTPWENEELVIKKGAYVWNYINISKSIELAKKFCNNDTVKSYLMTSNCYDTTIKWIYETKKDIILNSEKYGNYNVVLEDENKKYSTFKTGLEERYCIKNIYDIAGNAKEYTTEVSSNEKIPYSNYYKYSYGVIRDGLLEQNGDKYDNVNSLITRIPEVNTYFTSANVGFRVILILK